MQFSIGARIDVTDVRQILEKIGKSCEKVHRNMTQFNKRSRKKSRSVLQVYYMACIKFCHSPQYFLYCMAQFSHAPRQILPAMILALNVQFDLQSTMRLGGIKKKEVVAEVTH